MIDSQKYILTLEEDYDSYGGLPCSQEMWDSVIEFLVNLIASLEEDDISDSLLHPDIHYDGGKVMSVWWY